MMLISIFLSDPLGLYLVQHTVFVYKSTCTAKIQMVLIFGSSFLEMWIAVLVKGTSYGKRKPSSSVDNIGLIISIFAYFIINNRVAKLGPASSIGKAYAY